MKGNRISLHHEYDLVYVRERGYNNPACIAKDDVQMSVVTMIHL